MNPSTHDLSPDLLFILKETGTDREIKISFDDLDFIVRSIQLSFSTLFPEEPWTEEQMKAPQFKRTQATVFTNKFIPELRDKIKEEFGFKVTSGQAEKLYKAHRNAITLLKKSTEDAPSSACSMDSTASTSATNTQPPSNADSTRPNFIIGCSSNPVTELQLPKDSEKFSEP